MADTKNRTYLSCQNCRLSGGSFRVPFTDAGMKKMDSHLESQHRKAKR